VQFLAPDDGWKNRLKHVQRLTEINKILKCCILLVVICKYISDAWTYDKGYISNQIQSYI